MAGSNNPGCFGLILRIFGFEEHDPSLPYTLRESILTANEQAFYRELLKVTGDKLDVFTKVRVSDIFHVQGGKGYQAALNRINSKHIDFLLCQPGSGKPVLAIELDDRSHNRASRRQRDEFINRLFEECGNVPLLRIKTMMRYDPLVIRDKIITILNLNKKSQAKTT